MKRKAFLISVFIIIFIVSLIISIVVFNRNNNVAVIYIEGKEYSRIDLSAVTESYYVSVPHNEILVEPGQISVVNADCPDKLCIKQGKKHGGIPIICLPNKVAIVFEKNEGADALSW